MAVCFFFFISLSFFSIKTCMNALFYYYYFSSNFTALWFESKRKIKSFCTLKNKRKRLNLNSKKEKSYARRSDNVIFNIFPEPERRDMWWVYKSEKLDLTEVRFLVNHPPQPYL